MAFSPDDIDISSECTLTLHQISTYKLQLIDNKYLFRCLHRTVTMNSKMTRKCCFESDKLSPLQYIDIDEGYNDIHWYLIFDMCVFGMFSSVSLLLILSSQSLHILCVDSHVSIQIPGLKLKKR